MAVLSIASCEETWSLFTRAEEEELLLLALTEVDCPRLPINSAITVTFTEPGEELAQILLDLRTQKAFNWKSVVLLHDNTLGELIKPIYIIGDTILFPSGFYYHTCQISL